MRQTDPHSLRVVDYEWAKHAACRGIGVDIFFDSDPRAYTYCERCPVTKECADYAHANNLLGIWGGLNERQRANGVRYMSVVRPVPQDNSELAERIRAMHRSGMSWRAITACTGIHARNIFRILGRQNA